MGTIWVREFTGGLDTRRMEETTSGGALVVAKNGHISRGGEFEKRAAFVPEYTLPAGTVGLAAAVDKLVVFGSGPTPGGLPADVRYQRLQHPNGVTPLVRIRSYDLFSSTLYVVGEFEDGSIFHFFYGIRVDDWYDGRARASFDVTGGTVVGAVAATGSFTITGGTSDPANTIDDITVGGIPIIGAPIEHTGDDAGTATAVAAAINLFTSIPDYTATAVGATVNITAATLGSAANGRVVSVLPTGDVTVGSVVNMAGGANGTTSQMTNIRVNGVPIMGAPVLWATSNENTAALLAAAINAYVSTPDYTATAVGATVNIAAVDVGTAANGFPVDFTLANGFTVSPSSGLVLAEGASGKAVAATGSLSVLSGNPGSGNQINMVTVGGVNIMAGPVPFTGNVVTTAWAIAQAINTHTSTPDYTATVTGATVNITAVVPGVAANGKVIAASTSGSVGIGLINNMAGGADGAFQPGAFVKTAGKKIYSTSGSVLHFSGINAPTKWSTDNVGAGFIDMASETSGSEKLTAVAKYQDKLAVFAERTVLIEYVDPDPALNRLVQTLNNTGTLSPKSVTQFGDNDIFYLDESGLRSLKARDSSNAAATTDIGVPVDTLVTKKLTELTLAEREAVIGAIEPRDGRFWLAMKDVIFVFSFFNGAKVSAWSTYEPSYYSAGTKINFTVDELVVFNRRIFIRSGNRIFSFGGLGATLAYDASVAEAWLPYLDANAPTQDKTYVGVDAALEGEWAISVALEPTNRAAEDAVSIETETTFNSLGRPVLGKSTHISPRFRTTGSTYARLSSVVIHYEGEDLEDK